MQNPTTSGVSNMTPAFPPSPGQDQATNASAPAINEQIAPTPEAATSAPSLAAQAKQKLGGTLDTQKGTAADYVEQLAQTVRKSGQQFEGQLDWIASAIGRGAAELTTLAGSLRDKDLGQLAGEVQSFARRQPAFFAGATLVVGFAVARLGRIVASDVSRDDLPTVPEISNGQH